MRRRAVPVLVACAALLVAACVTVNVYFPEAEVRDLSQQIEEEVRRQAAERGTNGSDAAPQGEQPDSDPGTQPGASLLDLLLGVTPAMAQGGDVPAPEITSPAIRKIIDSRAARVGDLRRFKSDGVIGENNKGLLEVRNLEAVSDLRARADLQRLVRAENADREELYKEIAAAKNVDLAQLPRIRETYASTLRDFAGPGEWIQMPNGDWKQK